MSKFLDLITFINKNGEEVVVTSLEEVKDYISMVNEHNIKDSGYTGSYISPNQIYNGKPETKWDPIKKEYSSIEYVGRTPILATEYNSNYYYYIKKQLLDGTEYFRMADPQPTQENFSSSEYYIYESHTLNNGDCLPGATSYGPLSISIGCDVVNHAPYALVSGYKNYVSDRGTASITSGYNNINCGDGTAVFGAQNIAEWTATDSFVGGSENYATKPCSFTFGSRNKNQAQISAVFGQDNFATPNAQYCFIAGVGNTATEKYQVKVGSYSLSHGHAIMEVGIGSDSNHLRNGLEVRYDGVCIAGAYPSKNKPNGEIDKEYEYSLTTAGYVETLLRHFGGINDNRELILNARNGNAGGSVIIGYDNHPSPDNTTSLTCGVGLQSGATACQSNFGKFNIAYGNAALCVGWGTDKYHPETIFYIGCGDYNKGVVFSSASAELLDTVEGNFVGHDGVLITRQYMDYYFKHKNIEFDGVTSFNKIVNFNGGINTPLSIGGILEINNDRVTSFNGAVNFNGVTSFNGAVNFNGESTTVNVQGNWSIISSDYTTDSFENGIRKVNSNTSLELSGGNSKLSLTSEKVVLNSEATNGLQISSSNGDVELSPAADKSLRLRADVGDILIPYTNYDAGSCSKIMGVDPSSGKVNTNYWLNPLNSNIHTLEVNKLTSSGVSFPNIVPVFVKMSYTDSSGTAEVRAYAFCTNYQLTANHTPNMYGTMKDYIITYSNREDIVRVYYNGTDGVYVELKNGTTKHVDNVSYEVVW